MERKDPVLIPEWLKRANGGGGGPTSSANPNHKAGSFAHSDKRGSANAPNNRYSVNADDRDVLRGLSNGDTGSSSSRGGSSSNGMRAKDPLAYSSFGRSRRDRDRGREIESRGRDRVSDSFKTSSKDTLRHDSMALGQMTGLPKIRPGNEKRNGVVSGGSSISGIDKSSFERDFPSLGVEEKQRLPDRVCSPGIGSAIQRLEIGSMSVLVDRPAPQTPSATAGLNMAEALVQAPLRVRTPPQLSVDTKKIEELTLRQCKQLIPMTPSMPKASVLNPSDRSKSKGARGDVSGHPKLGQQASAQPVNTLRAPRSDVPKTSQTGNFQVLNRERNGICLTAKDVPAVSTVVSPLSAVASAAAPPLKSPHSPKLKSDSKGNTLSTRPLSQAQNRNDFFNSIRKQTPMNHSSANGEPSSADSSSSSEKSGEQSSGTHTSADPGNNSPDADLGFNCSLELGDGLTGGCDACEREDSFVSGDGENKSCWESVIDVDEEVSFMRSIGWEENAVVEALTAEEIDAFVDKHGKKSPSPELTFGSFVSDLPEQDVSSTAGSGSSGCEAKA